MVSGTNNGTRFACPAGNRSHEALGSLPEQDWAALACLHGIIAFYLGVRHAALTADRLINAGLDPATPSLIVTNISRADETHRAARLIDLADGIAADHPTSPALILIGAALDVARQPARRSARKIRQVVLFDGAGVGSLVAE